VGEKNYCFSIYILFRQNTEHTMFPAPKQTCPSAAAPQGHGCSELCSDGDTSRCQTTETQTSSQIQPTLNPPVVLRGSSFTNEIAQQRLHHSPRKLASPVETGVRNLKSNHCLCFSTSCLSLTCLQKCYPVLFCGIDAYRWGTVELTTYDV